MGLELADYERKATKAVMAFWGNRDAAAQRQIAAGNVDAGTRGAVTAGKNMNAFTSMIIDLVHDNGLSHARICQRKGLVTLPGYFRPTKQWDLLVLDGNRLIAAIELKSQVGSFGNNFNNRTEEAIGTAHDLWVAYREGALGDQTRPFVGWLMLVEDHAKSRCPVKDSSPHFAIFPEFQGASYLKRYDLLCQRLVKEQLYTSAALLASPITAAADGAFADMSQMTSLKAFVTAFAGHIATEAAMKPARGPSSLL